MQRTDQCYLPSLYAALNEYFEVVVSSRTTDPESINPACLVSKQQYAALKKQTRQSHLFGITILQVYVVNSRKVVLPYVFQSYSFSAFISRIRYVIGFRLILVALLLHDG